MDTQQIKEAYYKVNKLEKMEHKLRELDKTDSVDFVRIGSYNSGSDQYSYDVEIRNDEEFLKNIKRLIKDKLNRDQQKISNDLNQL